MTVTYATYVYDVFGNRIEKDVWTSTGGNSITRYGFDGDQAWSDLNSSNGLQNRYLRGDSIDELFARIGAAGAAAWYLPDHLGSIRNLTDNTGNLIDTIAYNAYGNITKETSPANGDRFKWADLQYDAATGLNFAKARPEDPSTGRWLEQDPLGFRAGDQNLYRFVYNAPNYLIDASGLASVDYALTKQVKIGLLRPYVSWRWDAELTAYIEKNGKITPATLQAINKKDYDKLVSVAGDVVSQEEFIKKYNEDLAKAKLGVVNVNLEEEDFVVYKINSVFVQQVPDKGGKLEDRVVALVDFWILLDKKVGVTVKFGPGKVIQDIGFDLSRKNVIKGRIRLGLGPNNVYEGYAHWGYGQEGVAQWITSKDGKPAEKDGEVIEPYTGPFGKLVFSTITYNWKLQWKPN